MNRIIRHGIHLAIASAMLVALGTVAGCQANAEKAAMVTSGIVNIGPAENYPAGGAYTQWMAKYGIVVVNDSGPVLAIRPVCGAKGDIAKWTPADRAFECPHNGAHYDLLGRPIRSATAAAPTTQPLPGIPAQLQPDGTLTINRTQLYAQAGL